MDWTDFDGILASMRKCTILFAGAALVACAAPARVQATRLLDGGEVLAIKDCATTEECAHRAEAASPVANTNFSVRRSNDRRNIGCGEQKRRLQRARISESKS